MSPKGLAKHLWINIWEGGSHRHSMQAVKQWIFSTYNFTYLHMNKVLQVMLLGQREARFPFPWIFPESLPKSFHQIIETWGRVLFPGSSPSFTTQLGEKWSVWVYFNCSDHYSLQRHVGQLPVFLCEFSVCFLAHCFLLSWWAYLMTHRNSCSSLVINIFPC